MEQASLLIFGRTIVRHLGVERAPPQDEGPSKREFPYFGEYNSPYLGFEPILSIFQLGPPAVPFYPFLGEGYPTKIDYIKKGTLILTSLLEDLANVPSC